MKAWTNNQIRKLSFMFTCKEFFGCDNKKAFKFYDYVVKDRNVDMWLSNIFRANKKTRNKFVKRFKRVERILLKGTCRKSDMGVIKFVKNL